MEKFENKIRFANLKEDTSRTELLPAEAEADSLYSQSAKNDPDGAGKHVQNASVTLKGRGWPQNFKTLRKARWKKAAFLATDILIALIPLVFVVLSIVSIRLSGSPISEGGQKVKAATSLGPTIFPILFAAIVGRSLRSLAWFQAERGSTLGTLEQLMGSLTIFATVELQVLLRTFDMLGIALMILWALSPLGGQASLRLIHEGTLSTTTIQNVSYLNPDSGSALAQGADTMSSLGFYINALYLSSLFTAPARQSSPMDTWSNVKIPTIEKLESSSKSDADGWYSVPPGTSSYSSLVGLPIDGTRTSGLSHFFVESLYMVLDCPTISDFTLVDGTSQVGFSIQFVRDNKTLPQLFPNQTSYPVVKPWGVNFSAASNLDTNNAFTANCTLTRSSVESNITCNHEGCNATNIRRSKFDQRPPGYTPLFLGGADGLKYYWPQSSGEGEHPGISTPTEYFIADPTMKSLSTSVNSWGISLKNLTADIFSERLSLVLNTYWQCSLVPWYQTGNFPSSLSDLHDYYSPSDATGSFNKTTATTMDFTPIYLCNRLWAVILLIASSALFLCGVGGAIVKHLARGPQILGYVSTMTRDNPYIVDLPSGGSTLDGLERTRLLRDLRVKVRDAVPEDAAGHIALSSTEPCERGKLILSRLYA